MPGPETGEEKADIILPLYFASYKEFDMQFVLLNIN